MAESEHTPSTEPPRVATAGSRAGAGGVRLGLLGGVAVVALGMIATIGGLLAPALFLPGVVVIGTGLLLLAVASVAAVWFASGARAVEEKGRDKGPVQPTGSRRGQPSAAPGKRA